MFGADAAQVSILENEGQRYETKHQDTFEYLFPKFTHQSPWQQTGQHRNRPLLEDFILIAEFSEQEGPRPVIVIPKDGGQNFDQNEFSVKILAVDHQSSIVEGCEITEDAQVVMSDPDTDTHAFIHHIVLNDIQARGYVRPFCISYVTSDPLKIMKCYEEISSQLRRVARLMKYGNRLVFMRDLEKYQEDLSYTKAHLLLSQNRMQVSAQGDSDLLNCLNTLRQCMEEVKDILSNLKPLIQVDTELSERFQFYERELRSRHRHGDIDSDSSSLKDFGSKDDVQNQSSQLCMRETCRGPCSVPALLDKGFIGRTVIKQTINNYNQYQLLGLRNCCKAGSYTDRTTTPEFSLFSKIKDQKPKILDVSTIRGKRRFDRSLRGLHELCSWGAKEGLQRLRVFREFLKRDLASIYVDELDMSALVPDKGVLCFSNNTVGANFLSSSGSIRNSCCVKRKVSEVTFHHAGLTSLGSVDSFKSLSSSFQSFYDDDTMYSASSSMVETVSSGFTLDRQISELSATVQGSSDFGQDDSELQFPPDDSSDTNNYFGVPENDWNNSLLDTLKAGEVEFYSKGNEKDELKPEQNSKEETLAEAGNSKDSSKERSNTTDSDFDNIDIEKDLKCKARGCACEKEKILFDESKCNIKLNGARMEDQKVNMAECNDGTETSDSIMFNEDIVKETHKEVSDTGAVVTDITEESDDNNGDLTPVMTDSSSTLFDQFSVIIDNDNHSNTDKDQGHKQIDKPSDRDIANVSNESGESKKAYENGSKVECMNDHRILTPADNERSDISSELSAHAKEEVSKNETKAIHIPQMAAESTVSSDSGLDIDNIHDKQSSIDFGSVSDKQSDEEFGKKDEKYADPEFRHVHDKHGHSSIHSEVRSAFGSTEGEKSSGLDASKRRKWKFMHPFKNTIDGDCSIGQSLQKVLGNYNSLQHIVYSLLTGKPVVVIGTRRQEAAVKELVQALSVFVPYTPRSSSMGILCHIKQLKMSDVHRFQLRGVIRSDKRPVDYLVPKSVRRYVTLVDTEKGTVCCKPYQGILLNFITSIHNKKKTFKSETALLSFIQLCLQEISTKAFSFYHTVTASNEQFDFSGATLPHKSSMLELSMEKYLNRAGVLNSDCRIIKHLTEIVKLQQIEDEFRSKYLTDAPAYPFSVAYQPLQTYRL